MTHSRNHESDRLVIVHDTAALEDAGGLGRQVEIFNAGSSEPEVLGGFFAAVGFGRGLLLCAAQAGSLA